MPIVVQKYGGSSVATPERIRRVADRIIATRNGGNQLVVIVSAMGDTTDHLIELADQLTKNPDPREMDMLLTTGEQVSISLLAMHLIDRGYPAISFTGHQLNIRTTGLHTKARIRDMDTARIPGELDAGKIVVVAGFQGVNDQLEYTTLGRGGSDTSAVALAVKLGARCEIYTDVEGIYSIDPRKYPKARKLDAISFTEMLEMASLGAGVMHPRAVELAQKHSVDLYVASSFSDKPGTWIRKADNTMEDTLITGMASDENAVQFTVVNMPAETASLARVFTDLAEREINVDMISQMKLENGLMNVSFTLPRGDVGQAVECLERWKKDQEHQILWKIDENVVKCSVVGIGMRSHPGVAATVFRLLNEAGIDVKMVTTSEIKISWLVEKKDLEKTIQVIASAFNL